MEKEHKIKDYIQQILSQRIRLVAAFFTTLSLFIISWHFLFTGINKRFILFTGICFVIGGMILFPLPKNKYTFFPATLLYLLIVPSKMFERLELPLHDMSRIQDGAKFVTILLILTLFFILLILTQRPHLALGFSSIILLIFFLINFYFFTFRGATISLNDLKATGTALDVINNYKLFMTDELWYSILYFILFIVWGFWCKCPYKSLPYHITISVISLLGIGSFYFFWNHSNYLENHGIEGKYWNSTENEQLYGFLLTFGIVMKEDTIEKPSGYSIDTIESIANSAQEHYIQTNTTNNGSTFDKAPNIIIIMNEAWSDLRILGNIETSQPIMPFYDSLTENSIRNYAHVGILGGLTANSEFEVLTGDTLSFLAPSAIPYQLQVDHYMPSLATVLKEQGYYTLAIHAGDKNAWSRNDAYDYLGFDSFVDANAFHVDYEYLRTFISDQCNYNEIIYQYENRDPEKPLFIFNVTIQNHADYYSADPLPISVETIGSTPATEIGYINDIETYLNLIKASDDAFASLITYFSEVNEPTIICMFGDHQPNLSAKFYETIFEDSSLTLQEQTRLKYITPYVIWTNYDSQLPDFGKMSTNYLGAAVLESAGVKLPDYYKFLLNLHSKYPILSHIGCIDSQDNVYSIKDIMDNADINNYRILQYNHLIEDEPHTTIFSVK